MTAAARERARVRTPILLASAISWSVIVMNPAGATTHDHHLHHGSSAMVLEHGSLCDLASGWLLMLVAMMLPLLASPIGHVRDRSFARRRVRATALFVASYLAVWAAAGVALSLAALAISRSVHGEWIPPCLGIAAALAWQLSPSKQVSANHLHAHPQLPAFGVAADLGVIRFGVTHGWWCLGSCWSLMLLPMLCGSGHLVVMAVVSLWVWGEQLDLPRAPSWCLRTPARAARLVLTQVRCWASAVMPGLAS